MNNKHFLKTLLVCLLGIPIGDVLGQTTFPSDVNVGISKAGFNNAAAIYKIYTNTDASSSTYKDIATVSSGGYDINGIGLNPLDHFIYGAGFNASATNTSTSLANIQLFRIGADGTSVDLGMLPMTGSAGSGSLEFDNFSAGVVDNEGNYQYITFAIIPDAVSRLAVRLAQNLKPDLTASDLVGNLVKLKDISSLPEKSNTEVIATSLISYQKLDFSDATMTAAINSFLSDVNQNWPNIYSANGGFQDIAINPIDNKLYSYISYPENNSTVGRPIVFESSADNTSLKVSMVGSTVNTSPGQEVTGLLFDKKGGYYGLFTTGGYANIDLSTGALKNLTASTFETTSGNLRGDLASIFTIALPIQLSSFTGYNQGSKNYLQWVTKSESNNKEFIIQRSSDGSSWDTLNTMPSSALNGNSSTDLSYSFTDESPLQGINYYRLKQVDYDGNFTFSSVISINSSAISINIYPSPTTGIVHFNGVKNGDQITVFSVSGNKVKMATVSSSANTYSIELGSIPTGIYFYQVFRDNQKINEGKFIKK